MHFHAGDMNLNRKDEKRIQKNLFSVFLVLKTKR